jgi:hypothetical protein
MLLEAFTLREQVKSFVARAGERGLGSEVVRLLTVEHPSAAGAPMTAWRPDLVPGQSRIRIIDDARESSRGSASGGHRGRRMQSLGLMTWPNLPAENLRLKVLMRMIARTTSTSSIGSPSTSAFSSGCDPGVPKNCLTPPPSPPPAHERSRERCGSSRRCSATRPRTRLAQAQASYVAGSPVPLPLASVLQAASLGTGRSYKKNTANCGNQRSRSLRARIAAACAKLGLFTAGLQL